MAQESSFVDLMGRLEAGDQDAAAQLFRRYAHQLMALARHRLDHLILRKVDPEDVVQSVFSSFFRRHRDGKFKFDNWKSLWGMLAIITVRKCSHKNRHFHTQAHDARKEVHAAPYWEEAGVSWEAIAQDPTPADAAMLAETIEHMLLQLDERDQQILRMTLQGYSVAEISDHVRRTERTVHRVLERVRERLEQELRRGPQET
jgi:RNA polymerase sigma-70 factor (ECF subfamily)